MTELDILPEAASTVGNASHPVWAFLTIVVVALCTVWIVWMIKFAVRSPKTQNGEGVVLRRIEGKVDKLFGLVSDHDSRIARLEGIDEAESREKH